MNAVVAGWNEDHSDVGNQLASVKPALVPCSCDADSCGRRLLYQEVGRLRSVSRLTDLSRFAWTAHQADAALLRQHLLFHATFHLNGSVRFPCTYGLAGDHMCAIYRASAHSLPTASLIGARG
jgi:hypothetical protein